MLEKSPIPAVGAVVIKDKQVLLVKRATPPALNLWAIPGGKIQFGETLFQAAERELFEETGIAAQAIKPIHHVDMIDNECFPPYFHFVIVDVLMRFIEGEAVADSDAQAVAWFDLYHLPTELLEPKTAELLSRIRKKELWDT